MSDLGLAPDGSIERPYVYDGSQRPFRAAYDLFVKMQALGLDQHGMYAGRLMAALVKDRRPFDVLTRYEKDHGLPTTAASSEDLGRLEDAYSSGPTHSPMWHAARAEHLLETVSEDLQDTPYETTIASQEFLARLDLNVRLAHVHAILGTRR